MGASVSIHSKRRQKYVSHPHPPIFSQSSVPKRIQKGNKPKIMVQKYEKLLLHFWKERRRFLLEREEGELEVRVLCTHIDFFNPLFKLNTINRDRKELMGRILFHKKIVKSIKSFKAIFEEDSRSFKQDFRVFSVHVAKFKAIQSLELQLHHISNFTSPIIKDLVICLKSLPLLSKLVLAMNCMFMDDILMQTLWRGISSKQALITLSVMLYVVHNIKKRGIEAMTSCVLDLKNLRNFYMSSSFSGLDEVSYFGMKKIFGTFWKLKHLHSLGFALPKHFYEIDKAEQQSFLQNLKELKDLRKLEIKFLNPSLFLEVVRPLLNELKRLHTLSIELLCDNIKKESDLPKVNFEYPAMLESLKIHFKGFCVDNSFCFFMDLPRVRSLTTLNLVFSSFISFKLKELTKILSLLDFLSSFSLTTTSGCTFSEENVIDLCSPLQEMKQLTTLELVFQNASSQYGQKALKSILLGVQNLHLLKSFRLLILCKSPIDEEVMKNFVVNFPKIGSLNFLDIIFKSQTEKTKKGEALIKDLMHEVNKKSIKEKIEIK